MEKISLNELSRKIDKPWSPVDAMFVNDSVIRMAKVEGEFVWHKHDNGDEVFLVFDGELHACGITIEGKNKWKTLSKTRLFFRRYTVFFVHPSWNLTKSSIFSVSFAFPHLRLFGVLHIWS